MGMRFHHAFALAWIAEFIHQAQAGHRVFGVADGGAVLRRDFQPRKFIGEGRAADQQRDGDAGSRKAEAVITIFCALFTSKPERPIASGWCSRCARINSSGGTLMPRLITS